MDKKDKLLLGSLGVLPEKKERKDWHCLLREDDHPITKDRCYNLALAEIANIDLAPALERLGYVKTEVINAVGNSHMCHTCGGLILSGTLQSCRCGYVRKDRLTIDIDKIEKFISPYLNGYSGRQIATALAERFQELIKEKDDKEA